MAAASVPALAEGKRLAVGDQEWFKRAATSTDPFVGAPWRAGPEILVGIYAPVRTTEGQLRGVLALDLLLKRVQDLLAQAKLSPGTAAALVTDRGIVVARQPTLFLMANVSGLAGYGDLLSRGGTGEAVFEDGESRIAGAVRIRPQGWTLVVGVPSAEVTRETRTQLLLVGGGGLALTALAILAGVRLAGRQAEGFGRLRQAMGRLETGDLPATLPVTVGGEAGALTDSFNRMLSWLRGKLREYEVVTQLDDAAGRVVTGDRSGDAAFVGLLRRVVGGVGADVGVLVLPDESGLVARAAVGFHGTQVEGSRLPERPGTTGSKLYGHRNVRLLNGGRKFWLDNNLPLSTDVPAYTATGYQLPEADFSLRAFRDDILPRVGDTSLQLVDVRSPAEFNGEVIAPPGMTETAQRAGHIPGAASIPWAQQVREDGTFKTADELTALYAAKGITADRDTIAYCRIGERSSLSWFVLHELLGFSRVRNYDGSWTEWGSMVGVPIEVSLPVAVA